MKVNSNMVTPKTKFVKGTEAVPSPNRKYKRKHLSLAKPSLQDNSLDKTSRYGRAHKPKHDSDDFLPTDAVLGKSPKKGKKSINLTMHTPILDDILSDVAYIRDCSSSAHNLSASGLSEVSNEDPNDSLELQLTNSSTDDVLQDKVVTDYEPGDLIWGRIGHHPFWPCIIVNDPEFSVFYKTAGRGRLMYHVLFYGDNGKRSWVASSMVMRFLGLSEFESKCAAITREMRRKDLKWFSGFSVKTPIKPRWDAAVQEAEAALPMTRDERVDAFLRNFPDKPGKRPKKRKDQDSQDSELEDNEPVSKDSPSDKESSKRSTPASNKLKKLRKSETPIQEKRKRGRPKKIDTLAAQMKIGNEETSYGNSPNDTPVRARKRKLSLEFTASPNHTVLANFAADGKEEEVEKREVPIEDVVMEMKDAAEKGYQRYRAKYISRISAQYPRLSIRETEGIMLQKWNEEHNSLKFEYVPKTMREELAERVKVERAEKLRRQAEADSSDDEDKDDEDGSGVEEEVATVASSGAGKTEGQDDATSPTLTISKKKVNLFRGYRYERVCQVCEKPGNTVKCRGPCLGVFHVDCARGADDARGTVRFSTDEENKPKKRGRKKLIDLSVSKKKTQKSKAEIRMKRVYAEEEMDSDLDYDDGENIDMNDPETVMKIVMGDMPGEPKISVLVEEESEEENDDLVEHSRDGINYSSTMEKVHISDFRCGDCAVLRTPLCFSCGQATDPSGEDSERHRCSTGHCGKHYHKQCLKLWPQACFTSSKGAVQSLTCPQHVCHTCVSDNPRDSQGRFSHEKLVRCVRCPTSYHYGNYCVPAGSEILTASQMICPRHYNPPKKGTMQHVNASWCFICSIGGSLICCDLCPSAIHEECLKIKPPAGGYICEDCETGRFPLYNEVLWVKLGTYRWWPALSLFPSEVPDNVKNRPHLLGEFAVRFLGTNDHYWIHRGRCFLFHEGDCVQDGKKTNKSYMDSAYHQGVQEANELHKAHKEFKAKMQQQVKPSLMKPPQYVKIKTNKPVGRVKTHELDTSNISPCECNPNSEHPCSPDSDCLNRILRQECDPNLCSAGERCENQAFEKRLYPELQPYRTDARGWGLQTLVDIKKGSFVIEYVGELIDGEEYQRRLHRKHDEKDENYYFLTIDSCRIIDAGPKGNVSRFMNHSCQPNCETQKWTVAGDTRVGLFALHDISVNSELTFNYNLESRGNEKKPCMCGTSDCSGFIGAKKSKVSLPEVKSIPSSGKKKRRKPRIRNLIEDICLICNADGEKGELITCSNKDCSTRYHVSCVGLISTPQGKWLCARHRCNICQKRSQQWCSYCTDSYCLSHVIDILVNDPLHGYICEVHRKTIAPADDHKKKREEERRREEEKKREEERKQKEEEKKKRDEEERAQRRTRREKMSSDEEVVKKKPKCSSDREDNTSETSSDNANEEKLTDLCKIKLETLEAVIKNEPFDSNKTCHDKDGSIHLEDNGGKKLTQEAHINKTNVTLEVNGAVISESAMEHGVSSLPVEETMHSELQSVGVSSQNSLSKEHGVLSEDSHAKSEELKRNSNESVEDASSAENNSCEEPSSSDGGIDEVPDADPSLDKFIVGELDTLPTENGRDTLSENVLRDSVSSETCSGIKRTRRPPSHNSDYIKTHVSKKSLKEMSFSKGDLSNELEDVALGFASDSSQESPRLEMKKVTGKAMTRGRGRKTLGVVRYHLADSTSQDTYKTSSAEVNGDVDSLSPVQYSTQLKPRVISKEKVFNSPEKVTSASLLAMQRAKGLKVMPPNRRLSLAREKACSLQSGNELTDKGERTGRGLKVLKSRRSSLESSVTINKTENLPTEAIQGGVTKRGARPVLTRVEDNGVSLDEDIHEKIVESNTSSTPKQSRPHSIGKKKAATGSKTQSPDLGVCPLWNQDILNIMQKN